MRTRSFPDSVVSLTSLRHWTVDYSGTGYISLDDLATLPEDLCSLSQFDLLYYGLPSLPESIGDLSHLQKLVLTGCWLYRLPIRIGSLSSLQHLDLSRYRAGTLRLPFVCIDLLHGR